MKRLYYLLFPALIACAEGNRSSTKSEQEELSVKTDSLKSENIFDAKLAEEYGADEYGMKPYIMAFLKTGPNTPKDSSHAVELQKAHMDNISRLAEEGKLVLAGPFYGNNQGEFRGIYIFNTSSIDSAKAYTNSDPAIIYGSLKMELIKWYGSAALMGLNNAHSKVTEKSI